MFKKVFVFIFIFVFQSTFSQVTFVVENLPENTPKNTTIYISGDFEGWTGGQEKYKLSQKNNRYSITLPKQSKSIDFKFTQGSWNSVEVGINGNSIDNRIYTFKRKNDTVKITILNWTNTSLKESTATKNVTVLSEDFYIPQLDRNRRIWVYLPPDYDLTNKNYSVVYMHDGQNLFDDNTSYSGEWQVDETLNKLYKEIGFGLIVIGIDNGGDKRLDEYSPWKNKKFGGGEGEAYINFIVQTLKPFVDKNYRTKSNKQNTAILGSSMGGLISYYAALKYPDIFTKIGVFSPSFWFSNQSIKYAKNHGDIKNTKMFFLAGGKEGLKNTVFTEISKTVSDMDKVIGILKEEGFNSGNISSKIIPDGEHNEKLWRENFKETILWLFDEQID